MKILLIVIAMMMASVANAQTIHFERRGILPWRHDSICIEAPQAVQQENQNDLMHKMMLLHILKKVHENQQPAQLPTVPITIQPYPYPVQQPQYVPVQQYRSVPQTYYYVRPQTYIQQPLGAYKSNGPANDPTNRKWRVSIDPRCQALCVQDAQENARRAKLAH